LNIKKKLNKVDILPLGSIASKTSLFTFIE